MESYVQPLVCLFYFISSKCFSLSILNHHRNFFNRQLRSTRNSPSFRQSPRQVAPLYVRLSWLHPCRLDESDSTATALPVSAFLRRSRVSGWAGCFQCSENQQRIIPVGEVSTTVSLNGWHYAQEHLLFTIRTCLLLAFNAHQGCAVIFVTSCGNNTKGVLSPARIP